MLLPAGLEYFMLFQKWARLNLTIYPASLRYESSNTTVIDFWNDAFDIIFVPVERGIKIWSNVSIISIELVQQLNNLIKLIKWNLNLGCLSCQSKWLHKESKHW